MIKVLKRVEQIAWQNVNFKQARCYHLAAIFRGNEVLAIGQNSNKTHPKILKYQYHDFSRLHAELAADRKSVV
jgi:hypothetical protein